MKAKLFLGILFVFVLMSFVSGSVCTDSDNGQNYYAKGDATFIHPTTGSLFNETDFCMSENVLSEQYCKSDYEIDATIYNCPNGCSDGACLIANSSIQNVPLTLSNQENCAGCKLDNRCYPLGYRKDNMFCSDANEFVEQKQANLACENNFECSTNLCIDNKCVSSGLWQKFIRWLSRLFG